MRDSLGANIKTLVVDRSPALVQQIGDVFKASRLGTVDGTESLDEARARLTEGATKYDLAIVEFGDAGEFGFDLLKWVRTDANSATPALPVIATSPVFTADQVKRSIDCGADYFLTKPFNRERLLGAVERTVLKPRRLFVTSTYVGPDRRTRGDHDTVERRLTADTRIHRVRDPYRFTVDDGALVIVFEHLPDGKPRALPADAVRKAIAAIAASREATAEAMTGYSHRLDGDFDEFRRDPFGHARAMMNATATHVAEDSSAAGFTLMSAVSRSLVHYTGGEYLASGRFMEFIKAHLIAFRTAVRHKILDDGGMVGRELMGLVASARKAFTSKN
ncbi:MAG: response regulator [Alphaproteobacteria bacterium]|nr:response regulator [Alphaproteobacteria bacterium]